MCPCVRACVCDVANLAMQAMMGGHTALVVVFSTDQSQCVQVYEEGAGSLKSVAISTVADYLTLHTHILRVTSSLPALLTLSHHNQKGQIKGSIS